MQTNHAPKQFYQSWRASHPPTLSFANRGGKPVAEWQDELRRAFASCLGEMPPSAQPETHMLDESDQSDHTRQKWVLKTEAHFWLPLYLLLPKDLSAPRPAVVALPGHGPGKSWPAGIAGDDEEREAIFSDELDYGLQAVREGYVTACPDMRGFGETVDEDHRDRPDNISCIGSAGRSAMMGRTLLGERVWDVQRLIDWLQARVDVDGDKIACVGYSGAGMVTMMTAAIEPRIKAAVVGSYLCAWDKSIYDIYHCPCNYVPDLGRIADCADIAALTAPRPQLFVSGEHDEIFPIDGVRDAFATVQAAYRELGAENRTALYVGDGAHRFFKAPVWPFVAKWLR
jgi:dienelactone hydrolase